MDYVVGLRGWTAWSDFAFTPAGANIEVPRFDTDPWLVSFEKLKAYQAALRLRGEVDRLRSGLDPRFTYAFEHVSRAIDSILLNLAEGSSSEYPAKRVVFYDNARNSANEAWSGLRFIQIGGGFTSQSAPKTCTLAYAVTKLVAGLIKEAKSRSEADKKWDNQTGPIEPSR